MTKMFTSLLLAGTALATTPAFGASMATVTPSAFSTGFENTLSNHQWRGNLKKDDNGVQRRFQKRIVTEPNTKLEPSSIYGTLYGPDDTVWYYTAEYTIENISDYTQSYTSAKFNIYNNLGELVGTINDNFELGENETSINQAEINPNITKGFFNSDDNYEVMIFCHATTTDYSGHTYNHVFTLKDGVGEKIMNMDGNQVLLEDVATYSWDEKYYMIFERDDYNNDTIYFDVYGRREFMTDGPQLKHTFVCDVNNIAAMADGLPIILTKHNGSPYYATAAYEKPYFDPDVNIWEDAVVQEDNNLVVTLYNSDFEEVNQIKVPVPTDSDDLGGYIYKFPVIGVLNSCDDIVFDKFSTGDDPAYVITMQNYTTSDDYVNSYYVYNSEGELTNTIFEDAVASLYMSDVTGQPDQFCFYSESEDDALFSFVDFPSCEVVAEVPLMYNGMSLSTSLDRVRYGNSYRYAISQSQGEGDTDAVTHKIHWFNADGSYNHVDAINLGANVAMAQVYISGKALTPYLFNNDDEMEYMFLVKRYIGSGSTTEERLVIYNTKSEELLDFGPTEDGALSNIMLINTDTNPQLLVTYMADNYDVTMTFTDLPLESAMSGSGTAEDPYLISTAGDFMQISKNTSAYYSIVNDIDFRAANWAGFGEGSSFTGSIEGNNHVLSNLNIDGNGIFEEVYDAAVIKDIVFDSPNMIGMDTYSGIIAGMAYGLGEDKAPLLTNIHIVNANVGVGSDASKSTIEGVLFGGLVGRAATYAKISDCTVENITIDLPNAEVGGIASNVRTSASITNCFVSGDINGGKQVGGIVASTSTGDETLSDCHVNANISGVSSVGGAVGYSKRTPMQHFVVEGTVTGSNTDDPAVGGLIGYLEASTVTKNVPVIITNNIVALDAIAAPDHKVASVHRIIGHSSAEDTSIDWENEDFDWDNFDWSDMSLLPTLPGDPELGLSNNYAVSMVPVTDVETGSTSIEGADLTVSEITTEFLTEEGFQLGETSETPWMVAELPYLYLENQEYALMVDPSELSLEEGKQATITFTLVGGDINNLTVSSSDESAISIVSSEVKDNTLEVTIEALTEGSATVTATTGAHSAACVVTGVSGVKTVATAKSGIHYNGTTVTADGNINIYSTTGIRVASGKESVNVSSLNKGIYLVVAKAGTAKIVVK
jgi:hypothetical protein